MGVVTASGAVKSTMSQVERIERMSVITVMAMMTLRIDVLVRDYYCVMVGISVAGMISEPDSVNAESVGVSASIS